MSPAVPETKRSRGRPKGSKDRVARRSALSNNDEARVAAANSSSSMAAPPAKRRASSNADTSQPNGFTPINVGDRSTSRSGRSLSKTPKYAAQAAETESLGPALKKRASGRSTAQVPSATTASETSTRRRLPAHGSHAHAHAHASPAPPVVPSLTLPPGENGYRSLYGQSPYGTPSAPNGAPKYAPSYHSFAFPPSNAEPPINTIQPAPGRMPAPRKGILRTPRPEPRAPAPAPPLVTISRPISEVFDVYRALYDEAQKLYRAFETRTWNIKIRKLSRNVFLKVAALRSRRARFNYMVKAIITLERSGVASMEFDRNAVWPPVLEECPIWYYDLSTPALRAELQRRIDALTLRVATELGDFEHAKITGMSLRRERGAATYHEMKWLEIQGQIKEFDSMLERLGDVDVRPLLTESE